MSLVVPVLLLFECFGCRFHHFLLFSLVSGIMGSVAKKHRVSKRRHCLVGSGSLLGLLALLAAGLGAGQDRLPVLVKLELGDDDVAGVDAQGNGSTVDLVAGDTSDVDDVLQAVDRGDLALLVLVGAADNGDLIVLADGDAADVVLLAQLLAERSAHDGAALGGGSREVSLARLAARGGDVCEAAC